MEINTGNQMYHSFQALHTRTLPNTADSLDWFKMQHWFPREDNRLVYKQGDKKRQQGNTNHRNLSGGEKKSSFEREQTL